MKNEIGNIEGWLENIKDADGIYVLDTGSTDGSYEKMLSLNGFKIYEYFNMVNNETCWRIY